MDDIEIERTISLYLNENIIKLCSHLYRGSLSIDVPYNNDKKATSYSRSNFLEYRILVNNSASDHIILAKIRHDYQYDSKCPFKIKHSLSRSKDEYKSYKIIRENIVSVESPILYATKALGYIEIPDVLFLEKVNGCRLYDLFTPFAPVSKMRLGRLEKSVSNCGRALKLLHSASSVKDSIQPFSDYSRLIQNLITCVSCCDLYPGNSEITTKIRSYLERPILEQTAISHNHDNIAYLHGDFHSKNIVVLPTGAVAFVDLALAGFGYIFEDIAQFLVNLRTVNIFTPRAVLYRKKVRHRLEKSFLNAYFETRSVQGDYLIIFMMKYLLMKWCQYHRVVKAKKLGYLNEKFLINLINRYFNNELIKLL